MKKCLKNKFMIIVCILSLTLALFTCSLQSFFINDDQVEEAKKNVLEDPCLTRAADTEKPQVLGISVSPATVTTFPTTVQFNISVEESGTGISWGLTSVLNPNGKTSWYSLLLNSSASSMTFSISFDTFSDPGEYIIQQIRISDYAGNTALYSINDSISTEYYVYLDDSNNNTVSNILLDSGKVTVNSPGDEDTEKPIIRNISASPSMVTTFPTSVTIDIQAKDSYSGIHSGNIYFLRPDGTTSISSLYYNSTTGVINRVLDFDQYAQTGIWQVQQIRIRDNAGNLANYFIDYTISSTYYLFLDNSDHSVVSNIRIDQGTIIVINPGAEDTEKPIINSISIDPNIINTLPATANITINAEDHDSGISWGNVYYLQPDGKTTISSLLYTGNTNLMTTSLSFVDGTNPGILQIQKIRIGDKSGNTAQYYIDRNISNLYYVYLDNFDTIAVSNIMISDGILQIVD